MRDAFASTLVDVADEIPGVFLVASDISPAGSIGDFRQRYPDRFYNVGVAEPTMVSICAGLALRGCKPFAYAIATFVLYRPLEQVRSEICYQDLPVTIVGIGAGVSYGMLGGTHHAHEDIAMLSAIPNMTILAPCDPAETVAATWACARHPGPTYLRLGRSGEPDLTSAAPEPFELGKLRMIKPGDDVCIISYGPIMQIAIDIANRIEREHGETTAVAAAHTLKPLDTDRIGEILNRFKTVIVFEEHSTYGGLGARVKETAWDQKARCTIHTFGLKDEFMHKFGTTVEMWEHHGLTADAVLREIYPE